jgi:hypothetical protein
MRPNMKELLSYTDFGREQIPASLKSGRRGPGDGELVVPANNQISAFG